MSLSSRCRVPKYRHYKPKHLGVVRLDGRDHYLGAYNSPESWELYHRLIADWLAGKQAEPVAAVAKPDAESTLTILQLLDAYRVHAEQYYRKGDQPTKELESMKAAVRPLRKLYGHTLVKEFGPKDLKRVRQFMVDSGRLSRTEVNRRVKRIRRVFRWAVEEALIPPSVLHGISAVSALQYGRTSAHETEPVQPVEDAHIEPVLDHVSPQVAAMIRLQRLCGMRPGEVVIMREGDIDRSEDVWIYEPLEHKNRYRGHRRRIPLGPRAQRIVEPFFGRPAVEYLFSPRDAEKQRNAERRANRQSPLTPSQRQRQPKQNPKRGKRERYDVDSYRRAVHYGIQQHNKAADEKAQIPHWSPSQLRHARATEVRRQHGLDGAQSVLGHKRADATQVYAQMKLEQAVEIARETG